ncbi:MAG: hypothetical protein AB8B91_14215 [Rubripirellula sp.]
MSKHSLRVFSSVDRRERELDRITGTAEPKSVSIPLSKVVPLLLEAQRNDCAWLDDFSDDLIRIDADLYEVLLAYQQAQQRAA